MWEDPSGIKDMFPKFINRNNRGCNGRRNASPPIKIIIMQTSSEYLLECVANR